MKPYFYTFNRHHGIPTVKHDSLEIAQGEAERLAAKQPGQTFEILRCVGIAQTSKASTFWMDGEEPPEMPSNMPAGTTAYFHYGIGQTAFYVAPEQPKYRMLELGEIIEEGDEFDCVGDGNWQPFVLLVGSKLATHGQPARRPL